MATSDRHVTLTADASDYIAGMQKATEATKAFTVAIIEAKAELINAGMITPESAELLVAAAVHAFGIKAPGALHALTD